MLLHLHIENYALIRSLDLSFNKGLTVITGETGAGKSILLGALALVLGRRVDDLAFHNSEEKVVVEAVFSIEDYDLAPFFQENDLEYDPEVILRRVISPTGKSRAFVNDTPVNLSIMKSLGEQLINIHSQHKTIEMSDPNFHLNVVDKMADNAALRESYSGYYSSYIEVSQQILQLKERCKKAQADKDYYTYLYQELEEANLIPDEYSNIEQELHMLTNAQAIKSTLVFALQALDNGDLGILEQLRDVEREVLKSARMQMPVLSELGRRFEQVSIELRDMKVEIESLFDQVSDNPQRVEQLNDRLSHLFALQQKHHLRDYNDLLKKKEELAQQLSSMDMAQEEIVSLEKQRDILNEKMEMEAAQLSARRAAVIPQIEEAVVKMLISLEMPEASFLITQNRLEQYTPVGNERIEFYFSANRGVEPQEIGRVASGGELSRLMLTVKSLLAKISNMPTIIFDEIDSGVSGSVAGRMGDILKQMGDQMQVISISHLPQIAAKSHEHYFVYKEIHDDKTRSFIKKLSAEEREMELAKMISDNRVTDSAIMAARELLLSAEDSKTP